MTALHDAIEYSALGWIKPELDETLRLVRVEIEGFADEPADTSRMRVCAELLHQVQGTLRMVELYAPAMVAEEMEQLAGALRDGKVQDHDGACSALMRGVVLLPDYLERLQSGHKEISIVLLPMLNELRSARGETGLSESVLFNPDLDRPLPATLPRATPLSPAARAHEVAPYLVRFRDALDAWPENGLPGDTEGLHFAVEALLARTTDDSQRRMLWVASLVSDALRDRALPADAGLRQVFASVDRESRSLFQQGGFGTPRADAAMEPTRQLLFHVAHAESDHPSLLKLRQVFELDALKPTESELDHARGSVAGRNRSLLDTVSAAIKEDLLRVKDELDLYLRTAKQDPGELRPQAERLQSVSDTLGMLGLGLARSLVQQQRDAMQDIVDGKRKADETALLEVAGALLYVDASLDDQVARLASGDGTDTEEDLANAEARKVLDVLVREAIGNFASARQAFVAFVETAWNHTELEPVPPLLREVSGALKMLELPVPASYLDGVRLYTEYELLARRRIPNSRQLDTFADALASVEYYLEALREQRANRDDILDITRNSLEALGYWPLPAERAVPVEAAPREVPAAVVETPVAASAPVAVELPQVEAASVAIEPVASELVESVVAQESPAEPVVVEPVAEAEPVVVEPAFVEPVAAEPVETAPEASPFEDIEIESIDLAPVDLSPVETAPAEPVQPPAPAPAPAPFVTLFVPPREPVAPPVPPVAEVAAPAPAAPEVAALAPAPVAEPAVAPLAAGFDATSDDIDDEIREIFLEEFEEEIGNLAQLLPAWKSDPNNIDLLQPVRRVFHTLKGSGRLVGARTLGEFSWKIENMLNKVRDGLRPATPPVVAMVDQAYAVLPQLHAALRGDGMVTADLRALEAYADRIAGGEDVMPVLAAAAPVAVPVEVIEVVEAGAPVASAPAPVEAAAVEAPVAADVASEVSVDPVLFEILQAEVSGHLVTIHEWLSRAQAAPTPADDPLLRAIHTMNGAFAMTEVPSITDALTPAEGYVRRLLATGADVDAEGVSVIAELSERIRDTVVAIAVSGGRVPSCDALAARLVALRDSLPEAGPVHVVDHPPAMPEAPVELTDLDLSAYGHFDLAPAAEAPSEATASPAPASIDQDQLAREAEAELARLFGQFETPAAPEPTTVAPVQDATPASAGPEDPARLLALMESYEAERQEAERLEADRVEAARLDAERAEAERLEVERLEAERLEAERIEAERIEALRRAEHEDFLRFETQRLETARLEAERLEAERLEAERLEAERLEAERLEAERLEAERLEAERLEAERLEAERLEAERLEAERLEAERLEAERLEAERLEAERLEAERLEAERLEAERLEAERLEAERLEAERLEAERLEAERLEAERLEAERLEAERLEAERLEAAFREQELQDLIRIEDERLEAERLEAERREAELLEAERLLAEGGEPEPEAHVELPAFADFVIPEEPALAAAALVDAAPVTAEAAAPAADSVISVLLAHSAVTDPDEALDMSDLDADLIDIFVEEGRDLLDHSDQLLVGLREAPEDRDIIAGLQRDLHTLKGGARMAGVMPIGELGHAMESLLEAAAEHRLRLGRDDIPLLETGFDRLHTMVTRVGDRRAVAVPDALVAAFDTRALGHALELPAHLTVAPEPEAPAFADFEVPTEAAAPVVEDEAFEIEEIALDAAPLDAAFADTLPAEPAAEEPAVDEPVVDEPVVDEPVAFEPIAFEPVPVETALVEAEAFEYAFAEEAHAEAAHVDTAPADVAMPEPAVAGEAETEEAVLEAQPVAAEPPTFAPLPGLRPLSAPMTFGDRDDEEAGLRGNQEQVRVRAELLDRLVNYAGEVAIYRSRLEQQLGAFRGATSEMEQTTARLRDQLRRLEIETEAQIIARYQREGEKPDAAFDPLELDRFSTLQQLSRALSETATDLGSLHTTLDDLTQQYETLLLQQSRVSSELQEGLMRTRMVPFDTVVPRLRRVLRQAAADTGRQVQLKVDGAQGELDRNVLERMTAPLEHMLRNSVAHGLESPAQRTAAGKPAEGVVVIAVRKEGSEVVLQITDDGRGLDRKAIRERGETRGLVRPGMALSNAQLDALIFEPGFSTAEEVTRLAGRGVGMDVVSSEVRQLGGTIDIRSEPGKGTDFILRLPQTLAVTQAAFVRIGETTYAVPIASVRGVGRIPRDELANGATTYRYGNEEYALHDLGKLVGETPAKAEGQLQMPLLLTRSGDLHVAVTVDQIVGNREIVVKPIGPQVASIPGIFGATIMGDGSVVVILDVAPLVRRLAAQPEIIEEAPAIEPRAVPLVMVVDDSITMRKVTGRVLERHNFEVLTAKDGLDALERMVDVVPDLMLLDIEMPRMDGYELATAMKADARLAKVPIIMITSRTGDKHRQRAMDIGVDRYLGKPYQENELMRNVFSLLEPVRSDA